MKTKACWLCGLNLSAILQAVAREVTFVILVTSCFLSVSGCMGLLRPTGSVLYKPSCDLNPVLMLRLPERIDTLAGFPRTETIVQNGINKIVGGRQPDEINEWFNFKEGSTQYTLIVFHSEAAAIKEYGRDVKYHPVFHEITQNNLIGRVHYTEEPRADPEGGSVPLGYYISRADFRLRNLYIRVEAKAHDKPQNDKLTVAVAELAQMLKECPSLKQVP